jgi:hypothetical protein
MGHTIEFEDRRIAAAAREWRDRRATGKKTKINELVSNGSYRDDEVALPDSFIHPYVGKVYPDGDTEVVSMSIQHFYSPSEALNFYQQDLDHFHFIVGILTASKEVVSRK